MFLNMIVVHISLVSPCCYKQLSPTSNYNLARHFFNCVKLSCGSVFLVLLSQSTAFLMQYTASLLSLKRSWSSSQSWGS